MEQSQLIEYCIRLQASVPLGTISEPIVSEEEGVVTWNIPGGDVIKFYPELPESDFPWRLIKGGVESEKFGNPFDIAGYYLRG